MSAKASLQVEAPYQAVPLDVGVPNPEILNPKSFNICTHTQPRNPNPLTLNRNPTPYQAVPLDVGVPDPKS